jgi:hypothetical protein
MPGETKTGICEKVSGMVYKFVDVNLKTCALDQEDYVVCPDVNEPVVQRVDGDVSYASVVDVDGNWLVVGNQLYNYYVGGAFVYKRVDSSWNFHQTLGPNLANAASFGASVSIKGALMVIGAYNDYGTRDLADAPTGVVYVFELIGDNWVQTKLLHADSQQLFGEFGYSIAFTGLTLVVGSPWATNNDGFESGAIYVFVLVGGNFVQTADIFEEDGPQSRQFGYHVRAHGSTIATSRQCKTGECSGDLVFVYMYDNSQDSWVLKDRLSENEGYFGTSFSVYGSKLVVGSPPLNKVHIYMYNEENWEHALSLGPVDTQQYGEFGITVDIYDEKLSIGASGQDDGAGKVYVFVGSGSLWEEQYSLAADKVTSVAYAYLGHKVALDENSMVVLGKNIRSEFYVVTF